MTSDVPMSNTNGHAEGTWVQPPPTRSTLVCPSCMSNMLYVPGGVVYRCDECRQVWQCVWKAATPDA
jgi:hypothetical protein